MLNAEERTKVRAAAGAVMEQEPNKATWIASVHLTNDFGLYMECRRITREALEEWRDNCPVPHLADALREYLGDLVRDEAPPADPVGLFRWDLLDWALYDIDYEYLAALFIDEGTDEG